MNLIASHLTDQLPADATAIQAFTAWRETRREAPAEARVEVEEFGVAIASAIPVGLECHTAKAEREAEGRAVLRLIRAA